MTDAISATRRQARELVDGTIEIRIHIDPRFKGDFYRLFPDIDMPIALAPLKPEFEKNTAGSSDNKIAGIDFGDVLGSIPAPVTKLKGGPRSKEAGKMCENTQFRAFLKQEYNEIWTYLPSTGITEPHEIAAQIVRTLCEVESRAELDHHESAWRRFQDLMREYNQWTAACYAERQKETT